MIDRIKLFFVVLLILLMAIQLSPMGLGEMYETLRLGIMFLTGVLFLFSCKFKELLSVRIIKVMFYILLVESFILFTIFALGGNVYWRAIVEFCMAFMFIVISYNLNIKERAYLFILNLFLWSAIYIGLSCIMAYGNGFTINEQYMPIPKNQIAPVLSVALFIACYVGGISDRKLLKSYYWSIALILFLCICVFRARANMVAVGLGLIVYLFFYGKSKKTIGIGIVLFIIALLFTSIGDFVYKAFVGHYDVSDANSLSAGRTDVYSASLEFLGDNPFFGNIFPHTPLSYYHGGITHNYLLFTLENYGFLGGLLLVLFYVMLLIYVAKINMSKSSKDNLFSVGKFVFIVPLVISIFEYTYPYSPGSAVFVAYLCFGVFERKSRLSR